MDQLGRLEQLEKRDLLGLLEIAGILDRVEILE
jgi:hypothetical protein